MATKKKTAPQKSVPKASRPAKKTVRKAPAKKTAKKAAPKKVAKRAAPKKAVKKAVRQAPVKKIAQKVAPKKTPKKVVRKAPAKKVAKKAVHKAPAKKTASKPAAKKISLPRPPAPVPPRKVKSARAFRKDELMFFRTQLQKQLDLIQRNLNALAGDNLKRSLVDLAGTTSAHSTHMADHGTDNFDRELALNLASSRQESLYDIEDAIRRVDEGTYGSCDACSGAIELPRLKALPFAKKCVACQNAAERGRTKYRPFGGTLPLQQLAAQDAADSPESMD